MMEKRLVWLFLVARDVCWDSLLLLNCLTNQPDNVMPTFQNYKVIFDFLRDHCKTLIFVLVLNETFRKRDLRNKP